MISYVWARLGQNKFNQYTAGTRQSLRNNSTREGGRKKKLRLSRKTRYSVGLLRVFGSPGAVGGRSTSLREERERSEIECKERLGEKAKRSERKRKLGDLLYLRSLVAAEGGNKVGGDSKGCGSLKREFWER